VPFREFNLDEKTGLSTRPLNKTPRMFKDTTAAVSDCGFSEAFFQIEVIFNSSQYFKITRTACPNCAGSLIFRK